MVVLGGGAFSYERGIPLWSLGFKDSVRAFGVWGLGVGVFFFF